MFMREFTRLHILVVASSFVAIANDLFLRFDYATIFWTIFLIIPNLWYLTFAKVPDGMVKLTLENGWAILCAGVSQFGAV